MRFYATELLIIPILISGLGTLLTILVVWKFKTILKRYFSFRTRWLDWQKSLSSIFHMLIKGAIGVLGIVLLVFGFILMPLPGPGAVVVILSVALLDLEFGWILPFMEWVIKVLPERFVTDQFKEFIQELKQRTGRDAGKTPSQKPSKNIED